MIHKNKHVWIIQPHCHGNGGWCGESVIKKLSLGKALKFSPKDNHQTSFWGDDRLRICKTKNIHDSIYIFNVDDWKWNPV